jgi:hypothetical protein
MSTVKGPADRILDEIDRTIAPRHMSARDAQTLLEEIAEGIEARIDGLNLGED